MEFKGITVGTYVSRKPKKGNLKDICANCKIYENIQITKETSDVKLSGELRLYTRIC